MHSVHSLELSNHLCLIRNTTMISIPKELTDVMSQLCCERLTFCDKNQKLIQTVQNDRNPQLPMILKSTGWKDDATSKSDYYIVKDADSNILFFFAIRCGLVQDLYDTERIEACNSLYPLFKEMFHTATTESRRNELRNQILPVWNKYELTPDLIISAQDAIKGKKEDRDFDQNNNTTQVWNTHPAIELALFCQNTDCKEKIKNLGFHKHFGTMVFWYYIMPMIMEARKLVGCEYVYLFAADSVNRGRLMDYYNSNLHFDQTIFLSGIKPQQDNNCFFMCQKVSELVKFQEDYLSMFRFDKTPDSSM